MSNNKSRSVIMKTILNIPSSLPLLGLLFCGCSGSDATIKSYIDPSLNSLKITSVAVFPLRNAFVWQGVQLGEGDMIEINRMFQTEFGNKNSKTQMLNSISSTELLNKNNLLSSNDTLMTEYGDTGIPTTQILNRIGQTLRVDAIIQGFLVKVSQDDGVFSISYEKPSSKGETKMTLRYVMFSTNSGRVLWEATCEGYKSVSSLKKAPPISDMIEIMRDKIITALPTL